MCFRFLTLVEMTAFVLNLTALVLKTASAKPARQRKVCGRLIKHQSSDGTVAWYKRYGYNPK